MTTWHLLLRAANLGPRNKIAMADLRRVLTGLGHEDVQTFLNSGNARFASSKRSAKAVAAEIEKALDRELGLPLRACVRTTAQLQAALDGLPADLEGYVVITFLFDRPKAAALREVLDRDWSPDVVRGGDQVLYLGYREGAHASKLQNTALEKLLGVSCTARTPATIAKMLA